MGDPSAPVMTRQEALMPQLLDHFNLIESHGAEGVIDVLGAIATLAGISLAAWIGKDSTVFLRQRRCNLMPRQMGLRMPVDEEQRSSAAFRKAVDLCSRRLNTLASKSGEKFL